MDFDIVDNEGGKKGKKGSITVTKERKGEDGDYFRTPLDPPKELGLENYIGPHATVGISAEHGFQIEEYTPNFKLNVFCSLPCQPSKDNIEKAFDLATEIVQLKLTEELENARKAYGVE